MVEIWKTIEKPLAPKFTCKKNIEKPLTPIVHMKKKHWKTIDTNGSHVKKTIEKPSPAMVLWQKPLPFHRGKNFTIAQVYSGASEALIYQSAALSLQIEFCQSTGHHVNLPSL